MELLVVVFALLTQTAAPARPADGFAPYEGARLLCSGHVNSASMHVTWRSYATRDSLETVVAHYEKTTGRQANRHDGGARFEWGTEHRLTIHPAAKNAEIPNCSITPTSDEQTVILISTAARPRPGAALELAAVPEAVPTASGTQVS